MDVQHAAAYATRIHNLTIKGRKMKKTYKVLFCIILLTISACSPALVRNAKKGNLMAIQSAVQENVNLNEGDMSEQTALMWACWQGHSDVVNELLKAGADVDAKADDGETALMWAALRRHTDIVLLLLEYNADPNIQNITYGGTGLMIASGKGNEILVKAMLEHGADVEIKDRNGSTALFSAVQSGNKEIVKMLIDAGNKINVKSNYGLTPLYIASYKGHS